MSEVLTYGGQWVKISHGIAYQSKAIATIPDAGAQ